MPIKTIAVPATIWSARKETAQNAKMSPPMAPLMIATIRPTQALLEYQVLATAAKAPMIMNPSSAMLVTPERSESNPPIAAKMSGAAERKVAVSKATEKKLVSASSGNTLLSYRPWWLRRLHHWLARTTRSAIA